MLCARRTYRNVVPAQCSFVYLLWFISKVLWPQKKNRILKVNIYPLGTSGKMHLYKEVANLSCSLRNACNKTMKQIFKAKPDPCDQYYLEISFILHSEIQLHIFLEPMIGLVTIKNIYSERKSPEILFFVTFCHILTCEFKKSSKLHSLKLLNITEISAVSWVALAH